MSEKTGGNQPNLHLKWFLTVLCYMRSCKLAMWKGDPRASREDKSKYEWVTTKTVASKAGYTIAHTLESLLELEELGYVEKDGPSIEPMWKPTGKLNPFRS